MVWPVGLSETLKLDTVCCSSHTLPPHTPARTSATVVRHFAGDRSFWNTCHFFFQHSRRDNYIWKQVIECVSHCDWRRAWLKFCKTHFRKAYTRSVWVCLSMCVVALVRSCLSQYEVDVKGQRNGRFNLSFRQGDWSLYYPYLAIMP